MKIFKIKLEIFIAVFVILTTDLAAHEYKIGNLKILHPYIIKTPPGAVVAGGYMKIVNTSNQFDRLNAVVVKFAESSKIHEMKMENDVMKMREVKGGLKIPAHGSVELKQGGYHIMFMNIIKSMTAGETYEGILFFEKSGNIKVLFSVEEADFKLKDN